jgi:hypothetical protein
MARLLLSKMSFVHALNATWQGLRARIGDHYRPERHYMRGPGPRARAKRVA